MGNECYVLEAYDFIFYSRWHDQWHTALGVFSAIYHIHMTNAMNVVGIFVIAVKAQLLLNNEEHDEATGNAQSKAADVDEREGLVSGKISKKYFEVISDHGS